MNKPDVTNEMMAEAIGWIWQPKTGGWIDRDGKFQSCVKLWNEDRNLVATLEDMLDEREQYQYIRAIKTILPRDNNFELFHQEWLIRHASAQACCDALYPIFSARKARGG
jgi:hypothetical protein